MYLTYLQPISSRTPRGGNVKGRTEEDRCIVHSQGERTFYILDYAKKYSDRLKSWRRGFEPFLSLLLLSTPTVIIMTTYEQVSGNEETVARECGNN